MKRTALIAALSLALGLAAQAQDQVLVPVLVDANNVIIKPNPQVLASANNWVLTSDALYAFITNATLVSAATGTVTDVASLNATITNIPAASVTSGNLAIERITNAAATVGASIGGNIPFAALTNAVIATLQPAYASGKFSVVGTTQLVFIAGTVTNVIDSDITTP